MYAIQKFVLQKMKESGLKKSDVAKRCGYTNISKGCRRLDDFLKNLELNPMIINNLHHALNIPESVIKDKLNETRHELELERLKEEEKERKRFVPYLFCQTERNIPSPIFVCAFLGADQMRFLYLPPDYNNLCTDEQGMIRKKLIAYHLRTHEGCIPTFGRITSFTLKRHCDENECEVYDLTGNSISDPAPEHRVIRDGRASLTIKGQDITRFINIRYKDSLQ